MNLIKIFKVEELIQEINRKITGGFKIKTIELFSMIGRFLIFVTSSDFSYSFKCAFIFKLDENNLLRFVEFRKYNNNSGPPFWQENNNFYYR